jgi:hypothetical protein
VSATALGGEVTCVAIISRIVPASSVHLDFRSLVYFEQIFLLVIILLLFVFSNYYLIIN